MSQAYTLQFIHRLNDDGTIDSICRECFVTVATALSTTALEGEEQQHRCEASLLERYKKVQAKGKFSLRNLLAH
jgi:hypothetical protein